MNNLKILTILVFIALFNIGCNNSGKTVIKSGNENQDSVHLTVLIRKLYTWHETVSQQSDFEPKINNPTDTIYSGLDLTANNKRITALKGTGFFSKDFLHNYQKISEVIDKELASGKTTWLVGDISPYGNDANPWCNCQDYPENYWATITLRDLVVKGDSAAFKWTWGGEFVYKVKAVKENDVWKISYLQGFEFKEYVTDGSPETESEEFKDTLFFGKRWSEIEVSGNPDTALTLFAYRIIYTNNKHDSDECLSLMNVMKKSQQIKILMNSLFSTHSGNRNFNASVDSLNKASAIYAKEIVDKEVGEITESEMPCTDLYFVAKSLHFLK